MVELACVEVGGSAMRARLRWRSWAAIARANHGRRAAVLAAIQVCVDGCHTHNASVIFTPPLCVIFH